MKPITDLLSELEPLNPIPTGESPRLKKMRLSAVVFDIYGTLLVSSSGDVDQMNLLTANLERAISIARYKFKDEKQKGELLEELLADLVDSVKQEHDITRRGGVPYPEVDIVRTWEKLVQKSIRNHQIEKSQKSDIRVLAYAFELFSNLIYPMPGMKEIIEFLDRRKIPLGIVSNAQSYTIGFMNYFLNGKFRIGTGIEPFDPDLCVFSFQQGKAKPDSALYRKLLGPLKDKYGVQPGEVLFVGNDMLNDIYPAASVGFRTALFAGDRRSLRWREGRKEVQHVRPDLVITELLQLETVLE